MACRADYMAGRVTFDQYYEEIAREAGILYANSRDLPRIKAALANGDEYLNTIPLHQWDYAALATKHSVQRVLEARGDHWSLAGGVCVHKAAARAAARGDAT